MDKDYLYRMLFQDNQNIMLLIDPNSGYIINANQTAIDFYGYSSSEFLTKRIQDINVFDEKVIIDEMNSASREDGNHFQFTHLLANNELREVEVYSFPVEWDNRKLLFSTIYDISAKVQQKLMLDTLFFNSPYAVVILDNKQRITQINDNFTELFQYRIEDAKGNRIIDLVSPSNCPDLIDNNLNLIYQGKVLKQEGIRKRKDGKLIDVEILAYPIVKNDRIVDVCIIYIDISQKVEYERRLHLLIQRDPLTKLYNRNYFLEIVGKYIKSCFKENREFAIVFIDLDRFKDINDSIGHHIGDELLIQLSNRLSSLVNESYTLSRFNGDEFVILCKDIIKNNLNQFLEILTDHINMPFKIGNNILHISVNIGISKYPDDSLDAETLVRFADIAMSKAKSLTDEKICFYSKEMSKEIEIKFHLNNYLVRAIENNEFTIHYQPIFDIKRDKTIKGAEALLRWNNAILGMIPPDVFIPIAEKTGQIITIGKWVLSEVCQQIKLWKENGYIISPISVNISVKQLEQIDFFNTVIDILKDNDVSPESIELEITESVSSGNTITIIKNLRKIKEIGIKISMDDFGTGFSSLGQLDLFELDKLKIDKIFIDDLVNVTKRQNLVKSIIAMANSLDLTVVAEGIETSEQLFFLKMLGCQLGQGYLFSRPIPAKDIEILLDSYAKK